MISILTLRSIIIYRGERVRVQIRSHDIVGWFRVHCSGYLTCAAQIMKAVELARFVAILAGMAAAASSSEELNFVIMGDWGGQDTAPFYTTAEKEVHGGGTGTRYGAGVLVCKAKVRRRRGYSDYM